MKCFMSFEYREKEFEFIFLKIIITANSQLFDANFPSAYESICLHYFRIYHFLPCLSTTSLRPPSLPSPGPLEDLGLIRLASLL